MLACQWCKIIGRSLATDLCSWGKKRKKRTCVILSSSSPRCLLQRCARTAARTVDAALDQTDVPASMVSLDRSAREVRSDTGPALIRSLPAVMSPVSDAENKGRFKQRRISVPMWPPSPLFLLTQSHIFVQTCEQTNFPWLSKKHRCWYKESATKKQKKIVLLSNEPCTFYWSTN